MGKNIRPDRYVFFIDRESNRIELTNETRRDRKKNLLCKFHFYCNMGYKLVCRDMFDF